MKSFSRQLLIANKKVANQIASFGQGMDQTSHRKLLKINLKNNSCKCMHMCCFRAILRISEKSCSAKKSLKNVIDWKLETCLAIKSKISFRLYRFKSYMKMKITHAFKEKLQWISREPCRVSRLVFSNRPFWQNDLMPVIP